jgi:RNA polymerase sigma factor (TIGR02999 family)
MTDEAARASAQITHWLTNWRGGDAVAGERLFEVLHPELRRIAGRVMARERRDHTLDPGALVNEACVRLLGDPPAFNDRVHFLAIAAQTMRRVLIDHARGRAADKRGGVQERLTLSAVDGWNPAVPREDVLALNDVLSKLEQVDPRAARVVELRFFGGLHEHEVAEVLGVSAITVKRDWKVARAWLLARLQRRA